jgi:hypothetical protein
MEKAATELDEELVSGVRTAPRLRDHARGIRTMGTGRTRGAQDRAFQKRCESTMGWHQHLSSYSICAAATQHRQSERTVIGDTQCMY